uniref:Uncharacterized protein n=1 Tax=Xiphophorus maculatus TaxID=8083 RepID=A0A3B5QFZ6_XIPMA
EEEERKIEGERRDGRAQGSSESSTNTCIHVIGPAAGLGAAAGGRGAARVKHIVHRALHLTVVDGLTLVGAERDGDERDYRPLSKCSRGEPGKGAMSVCDVTAHCCTRCLAKVFTPHCHIQTHNRVFI